jgi:hypothetical protein
MFLPMVTKREASRRVSTAVAVVSAIGSAVAYAPLLAWGSWATKWYLGVALVAALIIGAAAGSAHPRTRAAILTWAVCAFAVGMLVAPFVGRLIVYRLSGATD